MAMIQKVSFWQQPLSFSAELHKESQSYSKGMFNLHDNIALQRLCGKCTTIKTISITKYYLRCEFLCALSVL